MHEGLGISTVLVLPNRVGPRPVVSSHSKAGIIRLSGMSGSFSGPFPVRISHGRTLTGPPFLTYKDFPNIGLGFTGFGMSC